MITNDDLQKAITIKYVTKIYYKYVKRYMQHTMLKII